MEEGKDAEAFAIVQQASTEGDAEAVNYLAWFYDNGRFVETDRTKAASLYREAADQGVAYAQWRLGVMMGTGETPGTPEEAIALFEKAAAQDFTNAMTSLAVMHATGRGHSAIRLPHGFITRWQRRRAMRTQYAGSEFWHFTDKE